MRYLNQRVLIVVAVAAVTTTLQAQDTRNLRDRTVPLDLVEGLLASSRPGATPPTVVVGEVPPPMKGTVFIPPDARVLGGTLSSAGASVVLVSPADARTLEALYRAEQKKLGWSEADMFGSPMGAGFRDAVATTGGPVMLCRQGNTMTIQFSQVRIGETRVLASASDNNGYCGMMRQVVQVRSSSMSAGADPMETAHWPVLVNPPNARGNPGFGGFGGCPQTREFGGMQSTELTLQMKPEDLLAHYAKQLKDSGWTTAQSESISQSFTRTDSLGQKLHVRLTVQTFEGAPLCRRVSLQPAVVKSP